MFVRYQLISLGEELFFRGGKVDDVPEAPPLFDALQVYLSGSVEVQDGGNAAVQVVGELNALCDQEIRELAQRQAGVAVVVRTATSI